MSYWGSINCPTCFKFSSDFFETLTYNNTLLFLVKNCVFLKKIPFSHKNLSSKVSHKSEKAKPYNCCSALNIDILNILNGALLGDCHAERRKKGKGTRFSFAQEASHKEYLLWLHDKVATLGYCSPKLPKITTRLAKKGKIRYVIRFNTFTYKTLNYVHADWYKSNVKHVPLNIKSLLSPMGLAIWLMDDGGRVSSGVKFATNSFSYEDCVLLSNALFEKFELRTSVQSAGVPNQYVIYVFKESMPTLRKIVKPYMVSSMLYKLGG
ncbi:MAG: hypothetical protein EOP34_03050 [Rickettsiales bacterium]|nr:MAG: hypothetical protein EOP34_03050 [Rickettsiales bacterium]